MKNRALSVWHFESTEQTRETLYATPLSRLLRSPSFILTTYSDLTMSMLSPALYADQFRKKGLLPASKEPVNATAMGMSIRSIWLRLLFNPTESLCSIINRHLATLHQRYMIGIQIRVGGSKANYAEKEMLDWKGVNNAIQLVKNHMVKANLSSKDVFVFVSTDSDYVMRYIRNVFKQCQCVYSATEYRIGHSAFGSTKQYSRKRWREATKRAIVDLMILKDCDYLVVTRKSSFGKFAYELQQAKKSPVEVRSFLESRGLRCSVFMYNQTHYLRDYVSYVC